MQKNHKCLYLVDFYDGDFFIKVIRPIKKGITTIMFDEESTIRALSSGVYPEYLDQTLIKLENLHLFETYEEAEEWLVEKMKLRLKTLHNKIIHTEGLIRELKRLNKKMKEN